jgi:hypothetical protein
MTMIRQPQAKFHSVGSSVSYARVAQRKAQGQPPPPGLFAHPHSPDPRQKDTIGLCPKNCEAKARMKYIPASMA